MLLTAVVKIIYHSISGNGVQPPIRVKNLVELQENIEHTRLTGREVEELRSAFKDLLPSLTTYKDMEHAVELIFLLKERAEALHNNWTSILEEIEKMVMSASLELWQKNPSAKGNKTTAVSHITHIFETNISFLLLTNLSLNSLPSSIFLLKNLVHLAVFENQLKSIPNQIGKLINLKKACFHSNQLDELPITLGKCRNITYLDISNNNGLKQLPFSLVNLCKLSESNFLIDGITNKAIVDHKDELVADWSRAKVKESVALFYIDLR